MTAVVSIRVNGSSAATLSGGSTPARGRGVCHGWSMGAARRCRDFLQSVDYLELSGEPWALTLTIPAATATSGSPLPDSVAFHAMLRAMVERLRRMGAIRWVWVIEMTRHGTPHVHATVWLPPSAVSSPSTIVEAWSAVTSRRGLSVSHSSQCVRRMTSEGWVQYCAKHGRAGVRNYQRMQESLPDSWQSHPGRLWGYGGEWPSPGERVSYHVQLGQRAFWRYRRLLRSYCISRARQSGDGRWIGQARRMLRCSRPALSAVRPVNVWVPLWVSNAIILRLQVDYDRLLEAAGGDIQAVEPWSVEEYIPLSVRRGELERAEAAAAFSAVL